MYILLITCSGTGALAIFLRKTLHLDITTSDYDDQEIEENIAHNCKANGITPVLPHIRREFLFLLWGSGFLFNAYGWELELVNAISMFLSWWTTSGDFNFKFLSWACNDM